MRLDDPVGRVALSDTVLIVLIHGLQPTTDQNRRISVVTAVTSVADRTSVTRLPSIEGVVVRSSNERASECAEHLEPLVRYANCPGEAHGIGERILCEMPCSICHTNRSRRRTRVLPCVDRRFLDVASDDRAMG